MPNSAETPMKSDGRSLLVICTNNRFPSELAVSKGYKPIQLSDAIVHAWAGDSTSGNPDCYANGADRIYVTNDMNIAIETAFRAFPTDILIGDFKDQEDGPLRKLQRFDFIEMVMKEKDLQETLAGQGRYAGPIWQPNIAIVGSLNAPSPFAGVNNFIERKTRVDPDQPPPEVPQHPSERTQPQPQRVSVYASTRSPVPR